MKKTTFYLYNYIIRSIGSKNDQRLQITTLQNKVDKLMDIQDKLLELEKLLTDLKTKISSKEYK